MCNRKKKKKKQRTKESRLHLTLNHYSFLHFTTATAVGDAKLDDFMKPLPASSIGDVRSKDAPQWYEAGLKFITDGKAAVILLAGGQVSGLCVGL